MKLVIIVFMGLFLLISGCDQKTVIDKADNLLTYQITTRLPLYSKQKDELTKDVENYLDSSKPTVQEVVPVIDEIDLSNINKLESQYKILERKYLELAAKFSQMMTKYMAQLDQQQQKDFFAALDNENRLMLRKERDDRISDIESKFKLFFGSINGPQKQIIVEYDDYFKDRAKKRLDRRIDLHKEFRRIYTLDISQESRRKLFQEAFVKYQKDSLIGNKNIEILRRLVPTIAKDQREYFRRKVQEMKELIHHFINVDY